MNGYNIAANMYGMFPNIYNNQVALNDLSGLDLYYPTGMAIDPALTMNGSIFGINPYMGVTPFMPIFSGNSTGGIEDCYKQYEKYQNFMIDSQVRQQKKMRNADLQLNGAEEGIKAKAAVLHDKILRNEQQQIKQAYNSYVDGVRAMYGDGDQSQIFSRANAAYAQLNNGKSLIDDIREHGRDSYTQGVLQTLTFGFADDKTAEENIADLTGQPVGRTDKSLKMAGNVTGGMVVGGAAFGLSKLALSALKIASKSKTFIGMAIGGIAGLTAYATSKS